MRIVYCLIVILVWAGVTALVSWIAMLAWNFIVPSVFHGPLIQFWHSVAGVILLSIIGSLFRGK